MSRLDYFTITIVLVCLLAIGFLLYKTTNLFKKKEPVPIEAPVEQEDSSAYDVDEYGDSTSFMAEDTVDYWGESDKAEEYAEPPSGEGVSEGVNASEDFSDQNNSDSPFGEGENYPDGDAMASSGDYLVLGGTFVKMANAKRRLNALQRAGYSRAQIVLFDRGKYAVVLVDRFGDIDAARDLVADMKAKGLEAALYEKR